MNEDEFYKRLIHNTV